MSPHRGPVTTQMGHLHRAFHPDWEGQLLPRGVHRLSCGRAVSGQVERGGVASGWSWGAAS